MIDKYKKLMRLRNMYFVIIKKVSKCNGSKSSFSVVSFLEQDHGDWCKASLTIFTVGSSGE